VARGNGTKNSKPSALECFLLSPRRWISPGGQLSEAQCGFVRVGGVEYWYNLQLSTMVGDTVRFEEPDYFLGREE
jgi:hypothetical protein